MNTPWESRIITGLAVLGVVWLIKLAVWIWNSV